eukprot:TRINITY_DN19578_c0_g1_i1.p1 TRINITY_DN19578_c0_g1~~TRINITY_DN19578_c0_g1_i1.p1  ORF type:complete len:180 (+),score=38.18 TRINITY_DN19578_c0_g1_i1:58-597(+)
MASPVSGFGVSCGLPSRRRNRLAAVHAFDGLDLEHLPAAPAQKGARRSPRAHIPTLATCTLTDTSFLDVAAPRSMGSSGESLPDVSAPLVRSTRYGKAQADRHEAYQRSRLADEAIREKMRKVRFPSLRMLEPNRLETRAPVLQLANGARVNPDRRAVVAPRSFRSSHVRDAKGRLFYP